MTLPVPDFVPVPDGETMHRISILSLSIGVCAVAAGMIFLYLSKRKGEKKSTPAWIFICTGALLVINHGIQLIF